MKDDAKQYGSLKAKIAEKLTHALTRRFPQTADGLRILDVWTPATYSEYTLSEAGTYMAFGFSSRTVPSFVPGKIKGLDNVVLATQWQKIPGGLPGAASAGYAAAQEIDRLCAAAFPRRLPRLRPSVS